MVGETWIRLMDIKANAVVAAAAVEINDNLPWSWLCADPKRQRPSVLDSSSFCRV